MVNNSAHCLILTIFLSYIMSRPKLNIVIGYADDFLSFANLFFTSLTLFLSYWSSKLSYSFTVKINDGIFTYRKPHTIFMKIIFRRSVCVIPMFLTGLSSAVTVRTNVSQITGTPEQSHSKVTLMIVCNKAMFWNYVLVESFWYSFPLGWSQ